MLGVTDQDHAVGGPVDASVKVAGTFAQMVEGTLNAATGAVTVIPAHKFAAEAVNPLLQGDKDKEA